MKYNDIVQTICGARWNESNIEEREGAYGVAIVLAYLKGTPSNLSSMSETLGVPQHYLDSSFRNLWDAGVFNKNFNIKEDKELIGKSTNKTNDTIDGWMDRYAIQNAWCHIAAIASGIIYRNYN